MNFEVFARRLDQKLSDVRGEAAAFQRGWGELRAKLVEPMLKTAEKGFQERAFKAVCQTNGGSVTLWVTTHFTFLESYITFAPADERRQVEYAVAISYPEGGGAEAETESQFFALAELSHLTLERLLLEFADRVARL